jgi:hypothetical protein
MADETGLGRDRDVALIDFYHSTLTAAMYANKRCHQLRDR